MDARNLAREQVGSSGQISASTPQPLPFAGKKLLLSGGTGWFVVDSLAIL